MSLDKILMTTGVMAVSLAVGFAAGMFYEDNLVSNKSAGSNILLGQHKLINPLLACEVGIDPLRNKQLKPFKNKIERLIAEKINAGDVAKVSVYFRDLNDGMAFNLSANTGFEPASLIKIPVMLDLLKRAESDPGILKITLTYDGKHDWNEGEYFKPKATLEPGKPYTVEELIKRMIAYSDNNAYWLLLSITDRNDIQKIHNELGIEIIKDPSSGTGLITVKSYSIFLRVLYNSSFLNQEMSEKALEYLAHEEFQEGMSVSIPPDILVASKFAERTTGVNGEIKQLHDFGIVYYPNRPYLLSIMTEGNDFAKMAPILREISKIIYEEVKSHDITH